MPLLGVAILRRYVEEVNWELMLPALLCAFNGVASAYYHATLNLLGRRNHFVLQERHEKNFKGRSNFALEIISCTDRFGKICLPHRCWLSKQRWKSSFLPIHIAIIESPFARSINRRNQPVVACNVVHVYFPADDEIYFSRREETRVSSILLRLILGHSESNVVFLPGYLAQSLCLRSVHNFPWGFFCWIAH